MTTLFGTIEPAERPLVEAVVAKNNGWLPLLTVLFLVSYGLMTLLIVEQGQTIESQRALIRELFRDSTELSAIKMKSAGEGAQASQKSSSSLTSPSKQVPQSQAPTSQAPSSQADMKAQSQTAKQKSFRMPAPPASDLADSARSLLTI